MQIKQKVSGFFVFGLMGPDKRVHWLDGGRRKQIITNNGLDSLMQRDYCDTVRYFAVGTGNTAASATDSGLDTYFATSSQVSQTEFGHGSDFTGRYYERWTTYFWVNDTGTPKTLYEFGLTWLDTADPQVFNRYVVGAGITVPDTYSLVVKYIFRVNIPYWRDPQPLSLSIHDGTSLQNVPGTLMLVGAQNAADDTSATPFFTYPRLYNGAYDSTWNWYAGTIMEPYTNADSLRVGLCNNETQFSGMGAATNFSSDGATISAIFDMSLDGYTVGAYARSRSYKLAAANYPETTWRSIVMCDDTAYKNGMLIWNADANFTKKATRDWTFSLTIGYERA